MGAFEHYHRGHGAQGTGEEFPWLENELGFKEVCCAEGESQVCAQVVRGGGEDMGMVGVEFDLAGEVDEEVVVVVGA